MTRLFQRILAFISGNKDVGYVMHNTMQLLLLHGFSIGLSFLSNYILIKIAGVSDYGGYVYVFNLVSLLLNFCLLGVDTLLVKNISVYDSGGNYDKLKGVLFFSLMVILAGTVIVTFISWKTNFLFSGIENKEQMNWLMLCFSSLLLLSLSTISQASLQGLKKVILGQLGEKLIRPVLLLIILAFLFYFGKVTLNGLVWSNILAIAITFSVNGFFLLKHIGFKIKNAKPAYEIGRWSHSSLFFFLISGLYILNSRIDIFFLGLLKSNREVGTYNILLRVSEIISIALVIINLVVAPLIARLFAENNLMLLQKVLTRSAQMVLLAGLTVLISVIIFRNDILDFFGVNFRNSSNALLILCLGQFANIVCGSVGTLLLMSGNEKFSIISLVVSIIVNVILNIMLIPVYGIIGAAVATSGGLIIWNLFMYFFVRKKLNIRPTAFGVI